MTEIKSISEVQEAIKDLLSKNVYFERYNLEILCENSKQLDFMIKQAIAKIGIVATINTPELEFSGKYSGEVPFWKCPTCTITIAETPVLNRGHENYCTALDAALQIGQTLNEIKGFCVTSISQEEMPECILVTITFQTNIIFLYKKEIINKGQ